MKTSQKILDLLSSESPCDKCKYRTICRSHHKACEKLFEYIETGEIKNDITPHPAYEWYDTIYGAGHAEGRVHIVDSNTLYKLHADKGWSSKTQFIDHQIESVYKSSTGKEFLGIILPDFDEFQMYWAVTDVPHVVLGGIGVDNRSNGSCVVYLFVREYYQHYGIGTKLMEKAESMDNYIVLWAEEDAEAFYRKLGYEERSGTRGVIDGVTGACYHKSIQKS